MVVLFFLLWQVYLTKVNKLIKRKTLNAIASLSIKVYSQTDKVDSFKILLKTSKLDCWFSV